MCIKCRKNPCESGRRYCHGCYLERRMAQYYKKGGNKNKKRYGYGFCGLCKKKIRLNRPEQKYCLECYRNIHSSGKFLNPYEPAHGGGYCWLHRRIAEEVLQRKLNTNEVVHHLDDNPKNNKLTNLVVISRTNHVRLHHFIREQRAILEKSSIVNGENCWDTLIVPITTTWLETASVKVIKLWEIGQSAAEFLKDISQEEGSETMHSTP